MYRTYNARPIPTPYRPRNRRRAVRFAATFVLLFLSVYVAYALLRPVAEPRTTILPPVVTGQVRVNIPWPATGQVAFGADGYGLLSSHNPQKPSPTASVTKVITALAILEQKPLKTGEAGPTIGLTERDVALYNEYVAKDGAVVPVGAGLSMTQYEALQAILLPSANNIADTTAIWAFGSMESYTAYANKMVKRLGMSQTTVSDASGFSPLTVSTAGDLVKLGDAALDHPVLAEIIGQKQATFPNYGTIQNVNSLIGQVGIRGIKTGNTEEAGGCYLAAADVQIGGQKVTVITAIMGATTRPQAMKDSVPIIQSAVSQFQNVQVVKAGQSVGTVSTAWGARSDIVAGKGISVLTWNGTALSPRVAAKPIGGPRPANTEVGTLNLVHNKTTTSSKLYTRTAIAGPSVAWRLTHPF